jgi:hypothetical protein
MTTGADDTTTLLWVPVAIGLVAGLVAELTTELAGEVS